MPNRGSRLSLRLLTAALVFLSAFDASAGMRPHPVLTDLGRFRLDVISFFVVVILVLSGVVKLLWSGFRRDFPSLPRLTYGKACGVVALWGLLFVVVLAMISGARELMTPGAWEAREDGGYRLAAASESSQIEFARRQKLERLREALWMYAKAHGGQFPPNDLVADVPAEVWETVHPSRLNFLYVPGRAADVGNRIVAYEPGVYGQQRLALASDGTIAPRRLEEIREQINEEWR